MILALLTLAMDLHQPRIPLHFEPNQGQVAGETEWIAKAQGGTLYIKSTAIAFGTASASGKKPHILQFIGAKSAKGEGVDPTGGYSNYFIGRDEKNWHSGIPHYSKVHYKDVYKGIDLLYYATPDRQIEYDLEVAPGADLNQVELSFTGFDKVEIDEHGDLSLRLGDNAIRQHRPKVFQGGKEVACGYRLLPNNHVKIEVAPYDEALPLTVDPVLDFSTYLGGPGSDFLENIKIDSSGFIYLCGNTQTPASPSLNPFQQTNLVQDQADVIKLTPNADRILLFATLGSASGQSGASSLNVDAAGNLLVYGSTQAPDFPLKNAFQSQFKSTFEAAFVSKLTPDGRTLVYSSLWNGSNTESPSGSAVDAQGALTFGGSTASTD
ncbi:MAG TPA: SBBP repeat-containing protein, partial [Bryobacteraceae bacterium]